MTRAEKAGLKAYPENISYSTIGDTMYDYNAEKRRVYIEGYKQGYKDAANKACEWLNKNMVDHTRFYEDYDVHSVVVVNDYAFKKEFIEDFKKFMEEQQ